MSTNKYFILESSLKNKNNKIIKKEYYATIINNFNENEFIINIGGLKNKCIIINIPNNSNEAIITDISFHKKCSINSLLKKKIDMIQLIKCSLIFTIHNFPNITSFILSDNSYIECNNGYRFSLAMLYYLKYNKTWYEKNFDAISKNREEINKIKRNIENNLNFILELSPEDFIKNFYYKYKNDTIFINNIIEIYEKNMSLKSFVDKIIKYDCSYYIDIVNLFIKDSFFGKTWIINRNNIANFNINCNLIQLEKSLTHHKNINKLSDIERRNKS